MESGQEQNYWPGFVDALSNVVLTLVFVLVIFVFALMMASNKVEEKMRQVIDAQKAAKVEKVTESQLEQEVETLRKQLVQTQAALEKMKLSLEKEVINPDQIDAMEMQEDKRIVVKTPEEAARSGAVSIVKKNPDSIKLDFPDSVSEMDMKSSDDLYKMLDPMRSQIKGKKIIIRSVIGPESYSAAKRLAYYRVLVVRTFLMTRLRVDPERISYTIIKPETPDVGRVELIFSRE